MISEWLKVMLEEISSKKAEAERGRAEEQVRVQEKARMNGNAPPPSGTDRAQE
ncbi:MAG: hypothetical protein ABJD53_02460 [Gammaproteobacteria bacterium]